MKVVKATNPKEDVERVEPIAWQWEKECNRKLFGINLDPASYLQGLRDLVTGDDSDLLLLLTDDGEIAGYMGLTIFKSPLGKQRISNEHFWFVFENCRRGRGSMLLIKAAKEWAKEKGCSHLILNASTLASNMHDRLCKFYERIGFKKFETSYILKF